jgi:eukaryotic-like serine/threonine-protein kinase
MEGPTASRPVASITLALACFVVAATLVLAACGGSGSTTSSSPSATPSGGASSGTSQQHGLVWKFKTGGNVFSSPVVSGGVVYAVTDHKLYAVDAGSGQERWTLRRDSSPPVVAGGVVYFGGGDSGYLYAVDAGSGREKWKYEAGERLYLYAAPVVADGVVYFGNSDGHLYALDASSGREKWKVKTSKQFLSPAVGGGVVCCGSEDGRHFYALDASSGREKWQVEASWLWYAPAVSGGVVYYGSGPREGRVLAAVDADTGQSRGRFKLPGKVESSPLISHGVAYFRRSPGNCIVAVDTQTGKEIWKALGGAKLVWATGEVTAGKTTSSPVVSDGVVYFGGSDYHIYAVDAQSGQQEWSLKTRGRVISSPAVSGGVVYFGSVGIPRVRGDHYLYAVK